MKTLHVLVAALLGMGASSADEIRLKSGKTLVGTADIEGDRVIVQLADGGQVTLRKSDVASITFGKGAGVTRTQTQVPTLYMGVSPYRDVHSRTRTYNRFRGRGGRLYGAQTFAHNHGGHHGGHQGGHHGHR